MKIAQKTCIEFVDALASKNAVPGGGGAAALVGINRYGIRKYGM